MFSIKLIKLATPPSPPDGQSAKRLLASYSNEKEVDQTFVEAVSIARMEDLGLWEIEISGLGMDEWRAGLWNGLTPICLTLPEVAMEMEQRKPTKLFFWEQGIGRVIKFLPVSPLLVAVQGHNPEDASSVPIRHEEQDLAQTVKEFRAVFKVYYEAVEQHCPEVSQTAFWKEFVAKPEVQACLS